MSLSSHKFANAAFQQVGNYDRKFRKYVPFAELLDALRRHAAFGIPLKFVLDRDAESSGFFKRGPQWDFGSAGVSFEKREAEGANPTLVITWSETVEQKPLQETLDELIGLEFDDDAEIRLELVSPSGERKLSRYGNELAVGEDGATVHLTGSWQRL